MLFSLNPSLTTPPSLPTGTDTGITLGDSVEVEGEEVMEYGQTARQTGQ